jgi:hypothetical protein
MTEYAWFYRTYSQIIKHIEIEPSPAEHDAVGCRDYLAVEALFHHSPSAPQTAVQCREIIYLKKSSSYHFSLLPNVTHNSIGHWLTAQFAVCASVSVTS